MTFKRFQIHIRHLSSKLLNPIEWHYAQLLLVRLCIIIFTYTFTRAAFLAVNWESFRTYYNYVSLDNVFLFFLVGLQFDLIVVFFTNLPVIFSHLVPLQTRNTQSYNLFLTFIFFSINGITLFINIADIFYYEQALERSSGAILGMLGGFRLLFYQYSVEYWYGWLGLILFILVILYLDRKIQSSHPDKTCFPIQLIILVLIVIPSYEIGSKIISSPPKDISPLATNTPFILINSALTKPHFFNNQELPTHNYFADRKAKNILNINKNYFNREQPVKKNNIVLIILESFSTEFVGFLNKKKRTFTPFLDSLAQEGLIFTNSFANARHSNKAIPAIFSSMPPLMEESFITSKYRNNDIPGIAKILNQEKYSSAFFHGGTNGIYGFDYFAQKAGFEHYYGMDEYNNDEHYDGAWGIWDDKFFTYTAHKLNDLQQPFVAGLFSISSHHPFRLPPYYTAPDSDSHPIMACIKYTDFSLRTFFEQVKKYEWYKNTLFVITADHTSITSNHSAYYKTSLGRYRIPIIFYKPNSELKGTNDMFVQQIDILPSIIDYLNIDTTFSSLGKSIFTQHDNRFVYQFFDNQYQIANNRNLIKFDGEKVLSLYNHQTDSLLQQNLYAQKGNVPPQMLNYLKGVIQYYNYSMKNNTLE